MTGSSTILRVSSTILLLLALPFGAEIRQASDHLLDLHLGFVPHAELAAQTSECVDGHPPRVGIGVGAYQCVGGRCRIWSGEGFVSDTSRMVIGGSESWWGDRWDEVIRSFDFMVQPSLWRIDLFGPAAGVLQEGDILVAVNDLPITTARAGRLLGDLRAGETLRLTIDRKRAIHDVRVTPTASCAPITLAMGTTHDSVVRGPSVTTRGVRDRNVEAPRSFPFMPIWPDRNLGDPESPAHTPAGLGLHVECARCSAQPGSSDGQMVWFFTQHPEIARIEAGSAADEAGLREGDRITHVNGTDLLTRAGAIAFSEIGTGRALELGILRNGSPLRINVTPREERR